MLGNDVSKDGKIMEGFSLGVEPARLTVISKSSLTTVYSLHKKRLYLIPEKLRKIFLKGVQNCGDFDDNYEPAILTNDLVWEEQKLELLNENIEKNFCEREAINRKNRPY